MTQSQCWCIHIYIHCTHIHTCIHILYCTKMWSSFWVQYTLTSHFYWNFLLYSKQLWYNKSHKPQGLCAYVRTHKAGWHWKFQGMIYGITQAHSPTWAVLLVITKTVNKGAWQLFCLQDGIAAALLARLASKTAAHTLTLALMIFVIASKIAHKGNCDNMLGRYHVMEIKLRCY